MLLQADAPSKAVPDPAWAWAPFEPDTQRPWNLRWAGHLYRRAGFGATRKELDQALRDGPQRSIDRLFKPEEDVAAFNRTYDSHEAAAIDPGSGDVDTLAQWWLRRMLVSPQPLLEKMTLFWHHYFGTSNLRVGRALLLQEHIAKLRRNALGRFPAMVEEVSQDAATLMSLDAEANRKALPNENLARAMLEDFLLGEEGYSKEDIREAARAFTGWFVLRGRLRYIEREHDSGEKTILGQRGPWNGKDAIRIAAAHPATPRWVVRRLYAWLISETEPPADALVAPLAAQFSKDYDIARLIETMLRSNLFFSDAAYRRRVKCPVEYALGILRPLEELAPTAPLSSDLNGLGQKLGQPPTVRGWPQGRAWLNNFTLIARSNVAASILSGAGPYGDKIDPAALARKYGASSPNEAAKLFVAMFLQDDADRRALAEIEKLAGQSGPPAQVARELAHAVVTLPEFHLA